MGWCAVPLLSWYVRHVYKYSAYSYSYHALYKKSNLSTLRFVAMDLNNENVLYYTLRKSIALHLQLHSRANLVFFAFLLVGGGGSLYMR